MRVSRSVIGFIVFILATGLAFGRKVRVDYDHSVNFSNYRTFAWVKEPDPENAFMRQRIINAVNAQLMAKGREPDTTDPDIVISATATTEKVPTLNTFYSGGWGGCGWGWGGCWGGGSGWATTTVTIRDVGTLVVELLDAKTHQPLWQGVTTHSVSSRAEKAIEKLQKEIQKMFEDFPPRMRDS